ncbi:MAG: hypothetical protein LWY06_12835 [Firmicutes bacterium]|nr:hypothetical protein [Bacillota bacterium]
MERDCSICGVSFNEVPEEICIFCDSAGLGICVDCAGYGGSNRYCVVCAGNIRHEELASGIDKDPGGFESEYSSDEDDDYDKLYDE